MRVSVKWIENRHYLEELLADKALRQFVVDDQPEGQSAAELVARFPDRIRIIQVLVQEEPAGAYICLEHPDGAVEVHTCLTEECRGADALVAGRMALGLLFGRGAQRVVSFVPRTPWHRRVGSYVAALGGRIVGRHQNAWRFHGRYYDMDTVEWRQ
jgi:hypothetical protein